MKKSLFILFPVIFLALAFTNLKEDSQNSDPKNENVLPQTSDVTDWKVSQRQILLNGHPFFAQGVCYQPVPVGEDPNNSPNGDYFTSNYSYIYKPDIDRMKSMGINSIKIYSWYPDKDHTDFLNYCYQNGIYVIVGYYMPPGTIIGNYDEKLGLFKTLANMTKTHPAIMGYQLGNENIGTDRNNPDFWTKLNQIAAALKSIAPNKLVTTGLVDEVDASGAIISVIAGNNFMTSLDVWGINVFRGNSLGHFYDKYSEATAKPVLLTELGFPNSVRNGNTPGDMPNNGQATADYYEHVLEEVDGESSVDNPSDPVGGVYIFEWNDEWWKQQCPACWSNGPCSCGKTTHDFTATNRTDAFPGGWWDEEWFGIYTADRSPRASVETIKHLWKH